MQSFFLIAIAYIALTDNISTAFRVSDGFRVINRWSKPKTCIYGIVNKRPSIFFDDGEGDIDDEDDYVKYYPNEPTWLSMFPKEYTRPEMIRDAPDFEKLQPNDPLFLDMPWPTEKGPEASAFGRHMQWKRSLSDTERVRWQKWAVYQRVMMKDKFEYSVEDYILQNFVKDSRIRAKAANMTGNAVQASIWNAISNGPALEEEEEVKSVIGALYSAFNRRNYDELSTLWCFN